MAESKIAISDLKTIATTDRRVWAGAAFIGAAIFIWLATDSWREPPPAPEEHYTVVREKPEITTDMVKGFTTQIKEAREESQYLSDSMKRFQKDIQSQKEQIDWHTDTLVSKLNDVSEKVDKLATKVGSTSAQKARLDVKLKKQEKKRHPSKQEEED